MAGARSGRIGDSGRRGVEGRAGLALALEVHDLPPREALGTDGPAQSGDDLDDALEQGKVKTGDLVVMIGSGVGTTRGAMPFTACAMAAMWPTFARS